MRHPTFRTSHTSWGNSFPSWFGGKWDPSSNQTKSSYKQGTKTYRRDVKSHLPTEKGKSLGSDYTTPEGKQMTAGHGWLTSVSRSSGRVPWGRVGVCKSTSASSSRSHACCSGSDGSSTNGSGGFSCCWLFPSRGGGDKRSEIFQVKV